MQGSDGRKRCSKRSSLGSHHQERLLRGLKLDEQTSLHAQLELLRRGNQLGESWRGPGYLPCCDDGVNQ